MKMKNMHICIYMYIWINVDIWIFLKRMMKACLSLSFAVVHSRHVFRHNKHNNMHVCIQTSVKRMMKACIPLWLAIFHSEHVVHVCVCLSVCVCVLCGQDKRSLISLFRVHVYFVFSVREAWRWSLWCGNREYAKVTFRFFVSYQLHVLARGKSNAYFFGIQKNMEHDSWEKNHNQN